MSISLDAHTLSRYATGMDNTRGSRSWVIAMHAFLQRVNVYTIWRLSYLFVLLKTQIPKRPCR